MSCAKTAEPIDLSFSVVNSGGPKVAQVQSYLPGGTHVPTWEPGRADWRHVADTTDPSICGGSAVLCQITLTTCFYLEMHQNHLTKPGPAGGAYDTPPDPLVGWGSPFPPRLLRRLGPQCLWHLVRRIPTSIFSNTTLGTPLCTLRCCYTMLTHCLPSPCLVLNGRSHN